MNQKTILIIIGVLLALCCCVSVVTLAGLGYLGDSIGRTFENADNPENVERIASEIAEYEMPAGYTQMAFELLNFKYVFLTPEANPSQPFIMLMKIPDGMGDPAEMQKELERAMSQQTGGSAANMQPVEEKSYTIRGQQVKAVIMEGSTDSGLKMRQMSTIFQGQSGMVAMMFSGTAEGWDQGVIDAFIASIR
jgi:hypothetical protein